MTIYRVKVQMDEDGPFIVLPDELRVREDADFVWELTDKGWFGRSVSPPPDAELDSKV